MIANQFYKFTSRSKMNNLARLIQVYAVILIFALTASTGLIVFALVHNYETDVAKTRQASLNRVSDSLYTRQRDTNIAGTRLIDTQEKIDNLNHYFTDGPSDYLAYSLVNLGGHEFIYIPTQVSSTIRNTDDLIQVMLNPTGEKSYFIADGKTMQHRKYAVAPALEGTFTLTTSLLNPNTLRPIGTYYHTYQNQTLDQRLEALGNDYQQQLFVFNQSGREIYRYSNKSPKQSGDRLAKDLKKIVLAGGFSRTDKTLKLFDYDYETISVNNNDNEFVIIVLNNRNQLFRTNIKRVSGILIGWALVTILLFGLLRLTFKRYRLELGGIIEAMQQVGNHQLVSRVPVPQEDGELQTLGLGINTMLDQIQQYIREIYQAQIDQQAANLRALQAQINPHFLYNTLEYIRMSALSEGQIELADVIYNFAALMRHNITQETNATLADEIGFVEKYIYLYQMRFPKQVAYQITLPEELAQLPIPKFTLQPLVENYFVHGVDFSRTDNAIRVAASQEEDGTVMIEIVNNGEPIPEDKLAKINIELATDADQSHQVQQIQSIGLQNVASRLKNFYGSKSSLELQNNEYGGVTVRLYLRDNG